MTKNPTFSEVVAKMPDWGIGHLVILALVLQIVLIAASVSFGAEVNNETAPAQSISILPQCEPLAPVREAVMTQGGMIFMAKLDPPANPDPAPAQPDPKHRPAPPQQPKSPSLDPKPIPSTPNLLLGDAGR